MNAKMLARVQIAFEDLDVVWSIEMIEIMSSSWSKILILKGELQLWDRKNAPKHVNTNSTWWKFTNEAIIIKLRTIARIIGLAFSISLLSFNE